MTLHEKTRLVYTKYISSYYSTWFKFDKSSGVANGNMPVPIPKWINKSRYSNRTVNIVKFQTIIDMSLDASTELYMIQIVY